MKSKYAHRHFNSIQHKTAVKGQKGIQSLATDMWVRHRGSGIDQDISAEKEKEIMKHMPLAKPIEMALLGKEGLLGELLGIATNYILGNCDRINDVMANYDIEPDFIQREFVEASKWCKAFSN